jgi:hypothetical protein
VESLFIYMAQGGNPESVALATAFTSRPVLQHQQGSLKLILVSVGGLFLS